MNLNTHPENRKEMVKAISEHIDVRAQYMGIPTYAFVIGPLTVNRDGSISCEHPEFLDALKPMLIENGWLDAEAEPEAPAKAPVDSEDIPEDTEPIRVAQMDITMQVENWTVAQLTNLLRTFYGKQYLINRMLDYNMLYIEESFVTVISENPPETAADFEAVYREPSRPTAFRDFESRTKRSRSAPPSSKTNRPAGRPTQIC